MKQAFPPIIDKNAKILILGTMPSEESLRLQQYYGHSSNQFWKIMFHLFYEPFSTDYETRKHLLTKHNIALWDVLSACEGEGSADSAIKNAKANDFSQFFTSYPNITHVFFASANAQKFYNRFVKKSFGKQFGVFPSPSSANARISLAQKTTQWKKILQYIK
jgi:TDG/mug DNA glycosylase family protein